MTALIGVTWLMPIGYADNYAELAELRRTAVIMNMGCITLHIVPHVKQLVVG
jgi:hypothetical protein